MDKNGILLAVLFGWCGGYRFYKKQTDLGLVYLFTFGLFGIGWIVDIIISLTSKPDSNPPTNPQVKPVSNSHSKPAANRTAKPVLIEVGRFHTKVVGTTFPTTQGGCETRQEALEGMRRKDKLSIEYFEYKDSPAYRVVLNRNYSDIGNLSADLAKEIYRKYKDCTIKVVDWEVTGGYDNKKLGCNIELVFYRDRNLIDMYASSDNNVDVSSNCKKDISEESKSSSRGEDLFPSERYDNVDDLFNNIYSCCAKPCKVTEMERNFISTFIERLKCENIPCNCLLSRLSTGELVVYVGKLEVGRIKFNGRRNYMIAYAVGSGSHFRHYEAKTYDFYLRKMELWIEFTSNNLNYL